MILLIRQNLLNGNSFAIIAVWEKEFNVSRETFRQMFHVKHRRREKTGGKIVAGRKRKHKIWYSAKKYIFIGKST